MSEVQIIQSACSCGEPILVQVSGNCLRSDGKRPHYPESSPGTTVFRCRSCGEWLGDTCKDAKWPEGHEL